MFAEEQAWIGFYKRIGDAAVATELIQYFDALSGYPRDRGRAVEYFRRAAQKGHPVAQHDYGRMLVKGDSVQADRAAGIGWLRAAARQDSEQAKDKLRGLGEPIEEPPGAATGIPNLFRRLLG